MWIVLFNGKASHWLLCDASYTVGKVNCHITITDDTSISRRHLTIEIGLPLHTESDASEDAVAPVRLTDTSTYGTEVLPNDSDADSHLTKSTATRRLQLCNDVARHELSRDETFLVPAAWREFTTCVGTHGAALHFRWITLRVVVLGISAREREKVDECLSRCGAVAVNALREEDISAGDECSDVKQETVNGEFGTAKEIAYLLTPQLEPTGIAMVALCRALPIVTADFFSSIVSRSEPRFPLPDPIAFAPPADPFWAKLSPSAAAHWYSPRAERRKIFSGLTFVSVQRALFEETRGFVRAAGGCVRLDESLANASCESRRDSLLAAFHAQHQNDIVLFNSRERLPLRHCVRILTERLQLRGVEYADIVRAVIDCAPLSLSHSTAQSEPNVRDRESEENKQNGENGQSEMNVESGGSEQNEEHRQSGGHMPSEQDVQNDKTGQSERAVQNDKTEQSERAVQNDKTGRQRAASPAGRPTNPQPLFGDETSEAPKDQKTEKTEKSEKSEKSASGPAPGEWRSAAKAPAALNVLFVRDLIVDSPRGAGGKRFAKQSFAAPRGARVEFETAAPRNIPREIDAEDFVPDAVEAPRDGAFNVFDSTAHMHAHAQRTTRRRGGGQRANTRAHAALRAQAESGANTAAESGANTEGETRAVVRIGRVGELGPRGSANHVNIFDIESIF